MAGFLCKLPFGRMQRAFIFLEGAGGQLPKRTPGGQTKLAHQDNPPVAETRQNDRGTGVVNQFSCGRHASGFDDGVPANGKDLAAENHLRRAAPSGQCQLFATLFLLPNPSPLTPGLPPAGEKARRAFSHRSSNFWVQAADRAGANLREGACPFPQGAFSPRLTGAHYTMRNACGLGAGAG